METSKKTENKEKETGSVLFSPQPATRWFGCWPWKMKQKCTVGGEAASRQPLAGSSLLTPGPSAAQPKAMAGTNQRHAAAQTASVMRLLLLSMCLLQFFFFPPSERSFHLTCPQFSNYRCHDIKATTSWSVKNPCLVLLLHFIRNPTISLVMSEYWATSCGFPVPNKEFLLCTLSF